MAQHVWRETNRKSQGPHNASELPLHKIELERKQMVNLAMQKERHKELEDKRPLVAENNGDI